MKTLPRVAADLAHWKPITVTPDTLLTEAARSMSLHHVSALPVKERGRLVGLISLSDMARAMSTANIAGDYYCEFWDDQPVDIPTHLSDRTVSDAMSRRLYTVSAETPLAEVVRTMQQARIHRVLVLGDDGAVGVLSMSDLVGIIPELLNACGVPT